MTYITPQDRFQIQMRSMDESISKNNAVRFIDAFVNHLELPKLQVKIRKVDQHLTPARF